MTRAVRFVLLLVVGLAVLTWGASVLVQQQTREWFEKDVNLRANLAVSAARTELIASWRTDPSRLWTVLSDLSKDERILGACACSKGGMTLARTDDYPEELPCELLVARIEREGPNPQWGHWTSVQRVAGGAVHLSALPISDSTGILGYV